MHLWNAGIFLFSTSTILGAFAEFAPETLSKVRDAFKAAETDLGFTRLAAEPWSRLGDISIDYAHHGARFKPLSDALRRLMV